MAIYGVLCYGNHLLEVNWCLTLISPPVAPAVVQFNAVVALAVIV